MVKRKALSAKQQEQRLANAYDAGYFDGYHEGISDAHELWVAAIGSHPDFEELMKRVTEEAKRRAKERGVEHNEIYVTDEGCEYEQ